MERRYLKLLQDILINGNEKGDRTGTGTTSLFGYQMSHDLAKGFPLLTTKKMFWPAIVHELLWFISGDTNIKYLQDNGVKIWDEWADKDGNLGPVYGKQWRAFGAYERLVKEGAGEDLVIRHDGIDQLKNVVERIKTNPDCRRLIVSAWNPIEIPLMALPPCHCLFQFYVANGRLSCQMYQRSADVFLGVPFNIASYALLTMMIAHVTGLKPGRFIHTFGDVHIYNNHFEQVQTQLMRKPMRLPAIRLNPDVKNLFAFKYDDIQLIGYESHPAIKAPVAV